MELNCRASSAEILSPCNVRASQAKKTPRGPRVALNRRRPVQDFCTSKVAPFPASAAACAFDSPLVIPLNRETV